MEKQITIEKQKKLKNETMFNFKNVSLMKKQLFSLMMAFALVVGLSVSAWAQAGIGTVAAPQLQFPGALRTFTITNDADRASATWSVYDLSEGEDADAADCDPLTGTGNSFAITWESTAVGNYYIQVVDVDNNGCSTTRRFYVTIANFDVNVYACTSTGVRIPDGDAALNGCGNSIPYNAWDNDNATTSGLTFTDDDASANGDLTDVHGTDGTALSRRYVAVEISSDIDLSTLQYYWRFPFTVTSINADADFVRAVSLTTEATVAADGESTVTIEPIAPAAGMRTKIILALDWNVRWGTDIDFYFNIAQATTVLSANGTTYNAGTEGDNRYTTDTASADPLSNQSAVQTFYGAPNTSVISVN